VILSLRVLPGLTLALAQRDRPDLRDRPAIAGTPGGRGLVVEVNASARRLGIRPGITAAQARHSCPDISTIVVDAARNAAVGDELCAALSAFTPLLQPLEPGQVVCDLSGSERRWPDPRLLARAVQHAVHERLGLVPVIGIGANRLVAELASSVPSTEGITVVPAGDEGPFLADMPLTALPEVDAKLALTFQVLGLITAGQLAVLPAPAVRHRFGVLGERLQRYARGIDPRPIIPPPPRATLSASYDCEDGTPEEALEGLVTIAREIGEELERRNLRARMVTIRITHVSSDAASRALPHRPRPALPLGPLVDGAPGSEPERARQCPDAPAAGNAPQLPIAYRIHSYAMPQPNGSTETAVSTLPVPRNDGPLCAKRTHFSPPAESAETATALVRTPLGAADPLVDRARELLLSRLTARTRPGARPPEIERIELEVSEFARPEQLEFADLGLLGETALSPERREILTHGDDAWTARYGHTPFRHVRAVDPANVVAERRVQWAEGLRAARRRR
jgi:DNA polymerase IV